MANGINEQEVQGTVCPSCGMESIAEMTTESCNLITDSMQDVFTVCINAKKLIEYGNATAKAEATGGDLEIEDPCMECQHNTVVYDEGTMIDIEEIGAVNGRPQFAEVHECSCGTFFRIVH